MREIYHQIQARLDRLDFSALWPGFNLFPFALYDDQIVYLADCEIPWDERFLANTAIAFEGSYMAIWNMDFEVNKDLDLLTANIVHEMFHCYQNEHGESRFANDLELLRYPLDIEIFQTKYAENERLVHYIQTADRSALQQFVYLRDTRHKKTPVHIENEWKIETIEGAAEFVGMRALRQLAPDKFEERLQSYLAAITGLSAEILAVRRQAYYTGTLLLLALPPVELNQTELIYKQLTKEIEPLPFSVRHEEKITQILKEETEQRKAITTHFTEKEHITGKITGYDPMNMVRWQDFIYCKHFVKVGATFLSGPLVLEMQIDSLNDVQAVYRKNFRGKQ
ncbi:hypothetical protein [Jeotgalibaca porci]|uniref:hypothetical protein n=1 Tax=Jeotgalibaca porci TaxID=1868793 RepID=UPI00359FF00D